MSAVRLFLLQLRPTPFAKRHLLFAEPSLLISMARVLRKSSETIRQRYDTMRLPLPMRSSRFTMRISKCKHIVGKSYWQQPTLHYPPVPLVTFHSPLIAFHLHL